MNIVITLPTILELAFEMGTKTIELRSQYPHHLNVGEDGFFVVQKGMKGVSIWCRVSQIETINCIQQFTVEHIRKINVSKEWIINYCKNKRRVYLWHVDKVIRFERPLTFDELCIERAPQSFVYAPLSHGESF